MGASNIFFLNQILQIQTSDKLKKKKKEKNCYFDYTRKKLKGFFSPVV